jgi:CubicO group peptidase (beta-lactamase class C family)
VPQHTRRMLVRRAGTGLALVVVLLSSAPAAQKDTFKAPPPRFEDTSRSAKLASAFPEIDTLFRDYAAAVHIPGAAWGIVIDGELAHTGVLGYRDVPSKSPVTEDTVFRIASMTKSFTAIAILKLRDEGKLSLDDPAEKYVPEMKALVYPTSDSPRITIRHLLSHAEGFPEDNPWGDQQLADTDAQLSALIRAGIPFSNAPGIAYEYSNFGSPTSPIRRVRARPRIPDTSPSRS